MWIFGLFLVFGGGFVVFFVCVGFVIGMFGC